MRGENSRRRVRVVAPFSLVVALLAFVALGVPDTLLGVAWPSLRRDLGLPASALGGVVAAGMLGYLVSCLLADAVLRRIGVGRLLAASSGLVAVSLAVIGGADSTATIAAAAVGSGLGAGAIDTGVNAFAAVRFGPRIVSWLHAAYGVGASAGPTIMTAAVVGSSWRTGYGIGAATLAGFAALAVVTSRAWGPTPETSAATDGSGGHRGRAALGVIAFFVYAGVEVAAAQWSYSLLTEGRGLGPVAGGGAVAGFWVALTTSRIVAGTIAERIGTSRVLRTAGLGLAGSTAGLALFQHPVASVGFLGLVGVFAAPIFPALISSTGERAGAVGVGRLVGLQVAASYLGAAAVPSLAGLATEIAGIEGVPGVVAGGAAATAALLLGLTRVPRGVEATPQGVD